MMTWTDELIEQIDSYHHAALSYTGQDGYPVTLPVPFTFDREGHRFRINLPAQPPAFGGEPSPSVQDAGEMSLTLLRYDPLVANERYLLIYGQVIQESDDWTFIPSRVVLSQSAR
jgi:hypothetical protein